MKTSKICPKCQGTAIYTDAGMSKSGDRSYLPISSWSKLFLDTYVCQSCGFVEEYARDTDLKDEDKMKKLRENWKRNS